jgi:hypothetical protein
VSRRAAQGKAGDCRGHILDAAARRVNKFLGHALDYADSRARGFCVASERKVDDSGDSICYKMSELYKRPYEEGEKGMATKKSGSKGGGGK